MTARQSGKAQSVAAVMPALIVMERPFNREINRSLFICLFDIFIICIYAEGVVNQTYGHGGYL